MLTDSYFLNIYLFVKTKLEIQKALAEDSTVYEYDSVYDEMQKKKEENNPKLLPGKDRKVSAVLSSGPLVYLFIYLFIYL
jgi:hypothetical protein